MIQGLPTYHSFQAFAAAFHCLPTIIPDDDDDYEEIEPMTGTTLDDEGASDSEPKAINFTDEDNIKEPTIHIDDPITHRDEAMFLSWHIKLGHAPFRNIRWASQLGILPPKLAKCRNVICPACLYGKQKRRPWRTKGVAGGQHKIKKATRPGECVSVDQLQSETPGLLPQTSGKLTTSRFKVATIFVDHYSALDYVHVQESTSAQDTIEAKKQFERFM